MKEIKYFEKNNDYYFNIIEIGKYVNDYSYLGFIEDLNKFNRRHKFDIIEMNNEKYINSKSLLTFLTKLQNNYSYNNKIKNLLEIFRKELEIYKTKRRISKQYKLDIMYSQKYQCNICKDLLHPSCEIDHIKPLCNGGKDILENLQALCGNCHNIKSYKERNTIKKDKDKNINKSSSKYFINNK